MRLFEASLAFYLYCYTLCELLRGLIAVFCPKERTLLRELLLEGVGTLQQCAPMFDVGPVLEEYGLSGVFVQITLLECVNAYLFRDAIAQPCPLITSYARGKRVWRRLLAILAVQFTAATLASRVAWAFWRFGIHPKHTELVTTDGCTADLTVAIWIGCAVEGAAVFVAKAWEKVADEKWGPDADTRLTTFVNALFSALLCVLGINLTGLYANPIVAWACTFRCEGVSHFGHLLVYWLAPIAAWYLGELCFGQSDDDDGDAAATADEEDKKEKLAKKVN